MNKYKQREYTFLVVFSLGDSLEVTDQNIEMSLATKRVFSEEEIALIKQKVYQVFDKIEEIDAILSRGLMDWSLDEIGNVEKALLRIAVADIKYEQLPCEVAINEALELSKKYAEDASRKFINGVLASVVEDLS